MSPLAKPTEPHACRTTHAILQSPLGAVSGAQQKRRNPFPNMRFVSRLI